MKAMIVLVTLGLGATASPAAAADHVIRSHAGLISRVGPLKPTTTGERGVERLFGTPKTVHDTGDGCTLRFPRRHITVLLANFGGGDACAVGSAQFATVDGRPWRTQRGLRIGASEERLLRLYPHARLRRGWWELLQASQFGSTGPTLRARVHDGHVRKLEAFLGGAGD
jgi:hypothetical protein